MSIFQIKTYELTASKLNPHTAPVKFVLISDLHNKVYGIKNDLLIDAIRRQQPDAILIAGDILTSDPREPLDVALHFMKELASLSIPIYYGNGNHECRIRKHTDKFGDRYARYTGYLRELGVQLLENSQAAASIKGNPFTFYGYELEERHYKKSNFKKLEACELTNVFGSPDETRYNILLAHNPVGFDAYASWGADLTVSGHVHGGIIRIPGIGGVISPQARLFPKYDAGLFQKGERSMVVSPGLGTHTVNIRIFNPAQLIVITLRGAR